MADRGYTGDAALFVRWFVQQEPGWRHARQVRDQFLQGQIRLVTPDSVRFEVAHVLRNAGLLKAHFGADDYLAAVRAIDDLAVEVEPVIPDHLEQAAGLAAKYSLRIFDALVFGCSIRSGLPILTSDGKLSNALSHVADIRLLTDD